MYCLLQKFCDLSKEGIFILLQVLEEETGAQQRLRVLTKATQILVDHAGP